MSSCDLYIGFDEFPFHDQLGSITCDMSTDERSMFDQLNQFLPIVGSTSRGLGMSEQLDFVTKQVAATKFERCMNLVGVGDLGQNKK